MCLQEERVPQLTGSTGSTLFATSICFFFLNFLCPASDPEISMSPHTEQKFSTVKETVFVYNYWGLSVFKKINK